MYNLTFLKKYLFKALFPKKYRFLGNKVLNCIGIPSIPIKNLIPLRIKSAE